MATKIQFGQTPTYPLVDTLLTDIAHRIQLSPTDYGIAVDHYEAICEWLERDASPVSSIFRRLYAQGSMAIGATIASKLRNDEFDIDVIAEFDIQRDAPPGAVLDLLFQALNGDKGSRYHGKVERRTRCITVEYDRMHLDVTPAVLLPENAERTSVIFHAHEKEPEGQHKHIIANPWGFAHWFMNQTPDVGDIVEAVLRKSADPVPDQEEIFDKSTSLLALQLLKRWRNKCYDIRDGRAPPSIVIAYFVAQNAGKRLDLFSELLWQAEELLSVFANAHANRELVTVNNPTCETDIFTDRWPGDRATQAVFLGDLEDLVSALNEIAEDPTVEKCSEIMAKLFGENPTRLVVEDFQKRFKEKAHTGGLFTNAGTGGIALGTSGISSSVAAKPSKSIKPHTDFGSDD